VAEPYITTEELQARVGGATLYIELTDDTVPPDGVTDSDVEDWILDVVKDLANGYARRGGYTVPLSNADSSLLNSFLLDIANYKLKARRGTPSDTDRRLYEDAMKILEAVATGGFTLPSSSSGSTGAFANLDFDGYPQQLNRSTLRDL
jgi:phage gp36-like protein